MGLGVAVGLRQFRNRLPLVPEEPGLDPRTEDMLGARATRPARSGETAPPDVSGWLAEINATLAASGLPPHPEPARPAPFHDARQAWLLLRQAAAHSVRTGAAIVFF